MHDLYCKNNTKSHNLPITPQPFMHDDTVLSCFTLLLHPSKGYTSASARADKLGVMSIYRIPCEI